ncbi:UvrD-helicase domain-containing protein [Gordonia sp. KTR9]|uniref:UvrD-helicase domain-containing protein n=1 Tax=Gordonia sp. KTR9 TaxID=337191 RepID=UPI00027DE174|nr:UvrD-helicase domain-containing protein [Gordonia sp. KTR9]AFR49077.1 ATP-dependent exoDNAse (exonuclease V) beta subunit (contains helicase and exonuclease domains) [Gordonia sp. KTR9]
MTALALADQAARDRIATATSTTLFVEAGAGSGKTHSLVSRICSLVLDEGVELHTIAAITFTEKAAAELRERVRVELAKHDTDRANTALDQVDVAAIETLHAFAARIVRQHPLEAGVPPRVEIVDAMGSELSFERRWRRMQNRLYTDEASPVLVDALGILMARGVSVDQVKKLADALDRTWDWLELGDEPAGIAPADVDRILRETDLIVDRLTDCLDREDKLAMKLEELREWRILVAAEQDAFGWIPMVALCPKVGNVGRGAAWRGGTTQRKAIQQAVKDLRDIVFPDVVDSYIAAAVEVVVWHLTEVVLNEATKRQRSGQLEFHDLLVLANRVLDNTHVAADAHARYQRVLLDEFQDTDPLQIALAEKIVAGPDHPGRLFTVGDPKQSIYRFRRADISVFMGARKQTPDTDVVQLTTNFRSTRPVIDWVNRVFGALITPSDNVQAEYIPLDPAPGRPEWDPEWGPTPLVFISDEQVSDEASLSDADVTRARESRDVARIIATAVERGWCKESFTGSGYDHQAVQWKDICILIPSRTVLPYLEKSLDEAGIEFRSEASSLVYSTQEVHDLLLACRALANTADEAALVGSLRTPMFGCGDDDLLRWRAAGGYWSIFAEAPDDLQDSPIARAFAYLRSVTDELGSLNPATLLSKLATDRRVFEISMDSPRHRDVWRRLRFVIDQARAWYAEDRGSMRDYLDWAATQADENARVAETVLPEIGVNAVRIMTIHAAKGLQFPMVVLAGMSGGFRTQPEPVLVDNSGALQACISTSATTKGYPAARDAEKVHAEAEKIRLLYVACTRAESHLAVSGYAAKRGASWGSILAPALDGLPNDVPSLVEPVRRDDEAVRSEVRQSWDEWTLETARVRDASSIRPSYTVTDAVHSDDLDARAILAGYRDAGLLPTANGSEVVPAGRASHDSGKSYGTALHAILERIPLSADHALIDEAARGTAYTQGIEDVEHFVDTIRSTLASEPVRRAADREHWREMQLAGLGPDGTTVIEGIADLIYREDDGSLVVVDYKTDVGVSATTLEQYWSQLSIYAHLVTTVAGERVSALKLVFSRAGESAVLSRTAERRAAPGNYP